MSLARATSSELFPVNIYTLLEMTLNGPEQFIKARSKFDEFDKTSDGGPSSPSRHQPCSLRNPVMPSPGLAIQLKAVLVKFLLVHHRGSDYCCTPCSDGTT